MTTTTSYRVALYARVSTHNGQDPELQLRELIEYCVRRKWQISNEYIDVGIWFEGLASGSAQWDRLKNPFVRPAHTPWNREIA